MPVNLLIEPDDVYEVPLLAEVGDFGTFTQGLPGGTLPEGPMVYWDGGN
ncbi:hypothetical protein ACFU99_14740 [Streptomyces sp. NPDC057654]